MSSAVNCAQAQAQFPSQFHLNEVAADLAIAVLAVTIVVYLYNIASVLYQQCQGPMPRQPKHKRFDLDVNPLSGLLCAVVGITLILGTWPQPLEVAAILVVVLAQASALGWQDLDPMTAWHRKLGSLVQKFPDVFGVIVAGYGLGDARMKYMETTGNSFFENHDPKDQIIIAYVLTGAATLVALIEVLFFYPDWDKGLLVVCSFLFFAIQLGTTITTIRYTATTIVQGCRLFNATKICAMAVLGLGVIYSLFLLVLRCRREPVDPDTVGNLSLKV